MVDIRVVLVEPESQQNIGMIARAMANFGFSDMVLVNPVETGLEAAAHAKHAAKLLKNAKIVGGLRDATEGCELIVGTTGVTWRQHQALRSPISLAEFAKKASGTKGRIALLFGREGTGLSANELRDCDFIVKIPTDPHYSVLNVTHAAAIMLHALSAGRPFPTERRASRQQQASIIRMLSEIVDELPGMRNPEKVKLAIKRVVRKSLMSDIEARALLGATRKTAEAVKSK